MAWLIAALAFAKAFWWALLAGLVLFVVTVLLGPWWFALLAAIALAVALVPIFWPIARILAVGVVLVAVLAIGTTWAVGNVPTLAAIAASVLDGDVQPTPTQVPVQATAAPAAAPTYGATPAATVVTTAAAPQAPAQVVACPSEDLVHRDLNLPTAVKVVKTGDQYSVPTEPCKFSIQAVGIGHTTVTMVDGYQFTVTSYPGQEVLVYYGDGQSRTVAGATIRFLAAYPADHWVFDPENLLAHEFNFGWAQGRDPRYQTQSGNLSVPDWDGFDGSQCPSNATQVAGLVGGSPMEWTPPDHSEGAWVYQAGQEGQFYLLTASVVPGSNAWIDYWNGSTRTADRLTNWASLSLADASFHCRPAA